MMYFPRNCKVRTLAGASRKNYAEMHKSVLWETSELSVLHISPIPTAMQRTLAPYTKVCLQHQLTGNLRLFLKPELISTMYYMITESQNYLHWKRPSWPSSPTFDYSTSFQLEHDTKCHIQSIFECHWWW